MTQKLNKSRYFAIADLGSAALRMDLFSWAGPGESLVRLEDSKRILPRLGNLSTLKVENSLINLVYEELSQFGQRVSQFENVKIKAVGTAFLRDASDTGFLVERFSRALQSDFRVLSGEEEASLIALGVLSFEKSLPDKLILLDIGGGSTEVSLLSKNHKILTSQAGEYTDPLQNSFSPYSLPIGALEISRLLSNPNNPSTESIERSINFINNSIRSRIPNPVSFETLVGSSGTMRAFENLYRRYYQIPNPDKEGRIYDMNIEFVDELIGIIRKSSGNELDDFLESERHRKDLLVGGLLILREVARHFSIRSVRVSKFSLRHGVLAEMLSEEMPDYKSNQESSLKSRILCDSIYKWSLV
ncbi:MAG TPA: hypothetical protein PKA63_08275 [Oligoflexia bacterium]|nr:hypothetical protein [Oligoflexia bacterium]HMP48647.1 hypothetical protein [Oligoflexia bacterium]